MPHANHTTDTRPPKHQWLDLVMSGNGPRSSTTRYVLLAMSRKLSLQYVEFWVGQRTIADETGLSERAVRTAIKDAIASGWLERLVRGHSSGRRGEGLASSYEIKIPAARSGYPVHQPEGGSGRSTDKEGIPEAHDHRTGSRFRPDTDTFPIDTYESSPNGRNEVPVDPVVNPETVANPATREENIARVKALKRMLNRGGTNADD